MRVLVTGGAGFIGSHVAEAFLSHGAQVAVLDNFSSGRRENLAAGIEIFSGDICDRDVVTHAFARFRPDVVSHHAAQISVLASVKDAAFDARVNVLGGVQVAEAAIAHDVKQFVFASTGGAIYGEVDGEPGASEAKLPEPASPYAASKASFEIYLGMFTKLRGLKSVSLRYGNVFGPRQDPHGEAGVVAIFCRAILAGTPVKLFARETPGDGGCWRDYVYVSDVAAANVVAVERQLSGIYNVGTGLRRRTSDIVTALEAATGKSVAVEQNPPRPGDLQSSCLDARALQAQGWKAQVDFAAGLAETYAWFRAHN